MKMMDKSEFIFKILAYFFATVFAIFCLYPFIYAVSASLSSRLAMNDGKIILFPVDIQFEAFKAVIYDKMFWLSYSNTLFVTFYGTIWAMLVSILGAYALSKSRLIFRRGFNFLLVFTMWFSAGMIPTYLNLIDTRKIFTSFQQVFNNFTPDDKWVVVVALGMAAFNIILLRNAFEGVPKEIEEASIVDGANDFQILSKVYIPMSKAAIATVTLFYGLSRWNGYFWARQIIGNSSEWPLQVYIRAYLEEVLQSIDYGIDPGLAYAPDSLFYAMIVCAIIPIIIIYPYIQKYFARGVNLGGVKE